jgi:hypothetical protein
MVVIGRKDMEETLRCPSSCSCVCEYDGCRGTNEESYLSEQYNMELLGVIICFSQVVLQ